MVEILVALVVCAVAFYFTLWPSVRSFLWGAPKPAAPLGGGSSEEDVEDEPRGPVRPM